MTEKTDLNEIDHARSFFELVAESTSPMIVTDGENDAFVVMKFDEYERLKAATEKPQEEPQPTRISPEPETTTDSPKTSPTIIPTTPTGTRATTYENAQLPNTPIDADDYQRSMWHGAITDRMNKVVAAEAPIERQRLFNRVRGSFGIKRSGRDIQSHNEWLFGRNIDHKETRFNDTIFVWRPDQDPETYDVYRPTDEESNRQITEYPYEELVASMRDALGSGIGLSLDELIEATMRLLGYKRKTNRVKEVIGAAIEQANHDGVLELMPNGTFKLA